MSAARRSVTVKRTSSTCMVTGEDVISGWLTGEKSLKGEVIIKRGIM